MGSNELQTWYTLIKHGLYNIFKQLPDMNGSSKYDLRRSLESRNQPKYSLTRCLELQGIVICSLWPQDSGPNDRRWRDPRLGRICFLFFVFLFFTMKRFEASVPEVSSWIGTAPWIFTSYLRWIYTGSTRIGIPEISNKQVCRSMMKIGNDVHLFQPSFSSGGWFGRLTWVLPMLFPSYLYIYIYLYRIPMIYHH